MGKNRVFALLVVFALALSAFAGCARPQATPAAPTAAPAQSSGDSSDPFAPKDGVKYEITFINNTPFPIDDDAVMVKLWEERFNVKIDFMHLPTAEQIDLQFASGDIPDALEVSPSRFITYAKQGLFAPVPYEVFEKYIPNIVPKLEETVPGMTKNYGEINGVRYSIPSRIFYYNNYIPPYIYNGVWVDKLAGGKLPATFEEWEALMRSFAHDDPDGNGVKDTFGFSASGISLVFNVYGLGGFNAQWVESNGEIVRDLTLVDKNVDAFTKLNQLYEDEVLDPTFITGENTGGYWGLSSVFIGDQIGFSRHGSFYHWTPQVPGRVEGNNITELKIANPALAENIMYGHPVKGPDGLSATQTNSAIHGTYFCFSAKTPPDKIGKVLQMADALLGTAEDYLLTFYGNEGDGWNRNDDGSFTITVGYEDGMKKGAWSSFLFYQTAQTGSYAEGGLVEWGRVNKYEKSLYTNYQSVLTAQDFVDGTAAFQTDADTVASAAYIEFITGERPVSQYQAFVDEWLSTSGREYTKLINDYYYNR